MKKLFGNFDKLEDLVRAWFRRRPVLYALVGGVGVILFWRGVWLSADAISTTFRAGFLGYELLDGMTSLVIGFVLLASTGLFVPDFLSTEVMRDIKKEEKLTEKVEKEVETEESIINKIHDEVHSISRELKKIEEQNDGADEKK